MRILICGAGNGAHALAGILSLNPDIEVCVFINRIDKVHTWSDCQKHESLRVNFYQGSAKPLTRFAIPFMITANPEEAARHCDLIIFSLPAFLHLDYLTLLAPYIEQGCLIVGLPGQNGFEFDVQHVLGKTIDDFILINFESLPWVSRIVEFGKSVDILSTKSTLTGALRGSPGDSKVKDPIHFLQELFGDLPKLLISRSLLAITLGSPNAFCHPPILYGRWKDWDGRPVHNKPLLYHGVDEYTAYLIDRLSDEVLVIRDCISAECPQIDLSTVVSNTEWDIARYGKQIADKTNTMMVNRTNAAFKGICHPMITISDNEYLPDFNSRYLTEDIPFGLVVIRGIAEIVGVSTPYMDQVLIWCQQKLGKEYLVGSRLIGKDVPMTRCPQRYGLKTLAEVLHSGQRQSQVAQMASRY